MTDIMIQIATSIASLSSLWLAWSNYGLWKNADIRKTVGKEQQAIIWGNTALHFLYFVSFGSRAFEQREIYATLLAVAAAAAAFTAYKTPHAYKLIKLRYKMEVKKLSLEQLVERAELIAKEIEARDAV